MKRSHIAALFILVSLTLASCGKLVLTNGKPVNENRAIGNFKAISIFNNVNVKLVHESQPRLELTCPENLIEKVTTVLDGNTLVIRNENDFNWIRSFDYSIDLTVYYDSLREINYYSIGDLIGTDSIKGISSWVTDTMVDPSTGDTIFSPICKRKFNLNINEGSGTIDLAIDCSLPIISFGNGTSYVTLRGKADYIQYLSRSYGPIHAEELEADFVSVGSDSSNDIYVWAVKGLNVSLRSIGNVYYQPDQPPMEITVLPANCSDRVRPW